MWLLIFLTTLAYTLAESKALLPREGLLWPPISYDDPEDNSAVVFEQILSLQNEINSDEDYNLIEPRPPSDKRTLAMFSRWNPVTNIAKEWTPTRAKPFIFSDDTGKAQGKDRLMGQPLRWG